jgi:hypothetical protein
MGKYPQSFPTTGGISARAYDGVAEFGDQRHCRVNDDESWPGISFGK